MNALRAKPVKVIKKKNFNILSESGRLIRKIMNTGRGPWAGGVGARLAGGDWWSSKAHKEHEKVFGVKIRRGDAFDRHPKYKNLESTRKFIGQLDRYAGEDMKTTSSTRWFEDDRRNDLGPPKGVKKERRKTWQKQASRTKVRR